MFSHDNEKILRLRNETSLCLDDLVALVINSALALRLREFSDEIMEMTPGFAFSLKQAKALRDLTADTLKQYASHTIRDVDLMNYFSNARAVLKDEQISNGGNKMGLKDLLFHGKERRQQESMNEVERQYKEICEQILACEETMERCMDAADGHSPDSMVYRNSEREYSRAENELTMLRQQEVNLSKALEVAGRIELVRRFRDREKRIAQSIQSLLGNSADQERALAEIEQATGQIEGKLSETANYGDEVFRKAEEAASSSRTDSNFGAKMAARERRKSMAETDGSAFAQAMKARALEKADEDNGLSDSESARQ